MKKINARLKTSNGKLIQLEETSFRIGSFEGVCNYVLKDELASPIHGVIELKENTWYIQDTNSAAGITINGRKITPNTPILLNQNDTIAMANMTFEFIMDLELFRDSDVRLLNDLYKNWLYECDEDMQKRYQREMVNIINEKMSSIISDNIITVGNTFDRIDIQQNTNDASNETEVLSGEEGDTPTTVLNDVEGDLMTTVLNEESDDLVTVALSEEEGNMVTTVLSDMDSEFDDGDSQTTVLSAMDDDYASPDDEEGEQTVVLNQEEGCFLERVNSKDEKIVVDQFPFLIGKLSNEVNYCLDERGISRSHAKIIKGLDDGYFISDLDSKNGTYINGKRIPKDTVVKMNDGDMISFAEYNFVVTLN